MQDKILEYLKKTQDYVSGEEISSHLKISRQALWKHIQDFKDAGYEILAVPHLGYKLISSPDRLFVSEIKSGLHTQNIGKDIYYFDTLSSTNDMAMQIAMKHAREGTVILCETQSRGRGRLGRGWSSPKYKGIYLSLVLRPRILPNQAPILTLLSAVSICEAIKETAGLHPFIKWPNDILMSGGKVGGILTEINAEMDAVRFIICGIGLNVNNEKKTLVAGATSLKEEKGSSVNRISILQALLRSIEKNYTLFQKKGPEAIIEKWRAYTVTLGKRVKVHLFKDHLEGYAVDIDKDGGLLLRKDSGIIQKVLAGDVMLCRM